MNKRREVTRRVAQLASTSPAALSRPAGAAAAPPRLLVALAAVLALALPLAVGPEATRLALCVRPKTERKKERGRNEKSVVVAKPPHLASFPLHVLLVVGTV